LDIFLKNKCSNDSFLYSNQCPIVCSAPNLLIIGVGLISLVSYVLIFNMAPLNGEDYALTTIFKDISWQERILWIFDRAVLQANSWNARLGEMLAILWLGLPRVLFTVVACLSFVVFAYLSANLLSVGRTLLIRTFLTLAVIFPLWPGMELFFWRTVQAGYLQPLVITLGCMYLYRNTDAIGQIQNSTLQSAMASMLGLFAGLSFENIPVALILFILASLCMERRRSAWSIRTISPVITISIGWFILISAPSTTYRRQFYSDILKIPDFGIDYLVQRVDNVMMVFWNTSSTLLVVSLVAFGWLCISRRWGDVSRALLLFSIAIIVVFSVVPAPYTEPRSFGLAWALMLAVVVAGVHRLCEQRLSMRVLVCFGVLFGLGAVQKTYGYYSDFAKRVEQRDRIIAIQSLTEACERGIVVKEIRTKYPYRYLNNRDEWVRANPDFMARYYGCSIHIE